MIARISHISTFSSVAREHLRTLLLAEENLDKVKNDEEKYLLEEIVSKDAMIVILFSATALEAYIYDYAARYFSDSFVRNYIDKLDIIGKWVLIPRLITGKELPRDREWFFLLKEIIRKRNKLTHHKSSEIPSRVEYAKKHVERLHDEGEQMIRMAKESIRLLDMVVDVITENNPNEYPWVETYFRKLDIEE